MVSRSAWLRQWSRWTGCPTGLVKASLYHRFSGGKEEMAATVMDRVAGELASNLLAPLNDSGDPAERLRETGERLRRFYGSGKKACLLDTLTLNRESPAVRARAKAALEFWIDSFARFAEDSCRLPRFVRWSAHKTRCRLLKVDW